MSKAVLGLDNSQIVSCACLHRLCRPPRFAFVADGPFGRVMSDRAYRVGQLLKREPQL
jgi:hypothetical protein